ncbi:hypothetical protein Ahy_B06g084063 isoform B [Arachis hypogaea]|uniref:Prephenate/arogenate dehydrogenase domain-containing protein n=1 Tax=Arachis hypogaea TaxID=3818 RepID=A0A444YR60_ARAHY|nr:hypothetical protein Ahy_B06g084063 isoform B [Arachis hypogaea]
MFVPESAPDGYTRLTFIFEKVSILDEDHCVSYCEMFSNTLVREGHRMVQMSRVDHDRYAPGLHFITHTVGRIPEGLTIRHILNRHSLLPSTTLLPSKLNPYFSSSTYRPLRVCAIGATQLFDYESKLAKEFTISSASRSQFSASATSTTKNLGVSFFQNPDDLYEEHPEVILLCSSIISTERVLITLPLQRLKRSTLFVDVLSVKEFPKKLLLEIFPSYFNVLCTHPMFGPKSAPDGWTGLPFVFKKVRIFDEEHRISRCEKFLNAFAKEDCRMVEMSC